MASAAAYPPPGPPTYNQYQGQPQPGAPMQGYGQPAYGQSTNVVMIQQPGVVPVGGGCPHCHVGIVRTQYTLLGILIAFIFFPLGILCCLCMTERRCSNCNTLL